MSDTPVLRITALRKQFGSFTAVRDISFSVAAGEVLGLLGPNGAGKTTTLRVLAGLMSPTLGSVHIAGIDVHQRPLEARRALGFLTASTGLYDRLTGRELMTTFARLNGLEGERLQARVAQTIEELQLSAFVDKRCGTLSSGQKQRIGIARAIVHDPLLYVLDEPTATLDPVASVDILNLVQRAKRAGRAVVYCTHRMEEAQYLCSRLVFMNGGSIVAEGSPDTLLQQSGRSSLTDAFLHYAGALA